jgi:putative membrane protein
MDPSFFPPLNASLNGLATVFLILALILIKKGDRKGHARCMIAALVVSAVFLVSYITHKVLLGHANTPFPKEYPIARPIYLTILFTHIPLAIGMLPLIFIALRRAVGGDFAGHRRIVKWAYPIWLYVSVTGVIVYFMLYQWFPKPADSSSSSYSPPPPSIPTLPQPTGGKLVFEPEVFEHKAAEGETQFTATFVAKNTGTAPVRLTKLDSSCSCLKVESDTETVPPGGQATINAVFDIAKLSGDAEKRVFVTTDIPDSLDQVLLVKVNVKPIVTLEPSSLEWPRGGEPKPLEAVFRVIREKPIRILEAISSRESVACELKTIEEGREYRLILTPKSTADVLLGLVRIKTDCEIEEQKQQLLFFVVQDRVGEK